MTLDCLNNSYDLSVLDDAQDDSDDDFDDDSDTIDPVLLSYIHDNNLEVHQGF